MVANRANYSKQIAEIDGRYGFFGVFQICWIFLKMGNSIVDFLEFTQNFLSIRI